MAGIEDFVVEGVMRDMQQQPQPQAAPLTGSVMGGNVYSDIPGGGSQQDYANRLVAARPNLTVNPETGQQFGAYADQAQREQVAALQRRDAARNTIMQAMKGLDPQIQGTILKRLGIDVGPIKSELDQQRELLQYKQQLQAPQQATENALKMMGIQRQLGQGERELELRERQFQAETAGRGDTRNIQLMRVLAMMMQSNPQLQSIIGPLLLQLLQGSGINLAPPAQQPRATSGRGTFSPRPGVKITQEE